MRLAINHADAPSPWRDFRFEVYFVVFNRRERGAQQPIEQKFESAEILKQKTTAPMASGNVEDASVIRMEAASIAEAQMAVKHFYGAQNGTPVCVTSAQFKES